MCVKNLSPHILVVTGVTVAQGNAIEREDRVIQHGAAMRAGGLAVSSGGRQSVPAARAVARRFDLMLT